MMFRVTAFALMVVSTMLFLPAISRADTSALIIQGIGGDEKQEGKFQKWAVETAGLLVSDMGLAKDRVILLQGAQNSKPSVEKAFAQLKQTIKPDDTFLLIMIGQGSFDTDYKLAITGADLRGAEYSQLIDSLGAARNVIISSTPSSGGMFETLKGKKRVLITASRSGEKEDTIFYQHFLDGLKGAAADADKDKRVSAWEAFRYATAGVERFYKEQGRLLTEHAAVSADGAAQVTSATPDSEAPVLARLTVLNSDRAVTVADPRLQVLLNEKREIEQKIEALRLNKALMAEAQYQEQLEALVLQLAEKNAQIREQEKK